MKTFKVIPERISRNKNPDPFTVEASEANNLAESIAGAIHNEVKQHLMSSEFMVTVDIEDMTFSIGSGRYGEGTIEEVKE